jgi:hypothetical protein
MFYSFYEQAWYLQITLVFLHREDPDIFGDFALAL